MRMKGREYKKEEEEVRRGKKRGEGIKMRERR